MDHQIFARALPQKLSIEERYSYHATISGNPMTDEKGQPEGEIQIEVPFDGDQYFTRTAYTDVCWQHQATSGDLTAKIGHLAISGISLDELWAHDGSSSRKRVLDLEVPVPGEPGQLRTLIDDRSSALLSHTYQPGWPDVSPLPVPVSLTINLLDEMTIFSEAALEDPATMAKKYWDNIDQELSFERSLLFEIVIDLALPEKIKLNRPPVLDFFRLEWPVATSYHQLDLLSDDKENNDLFYVPEEGSVELRGMTFLRLKSGPDKIKDIIQYRTPAMILNIREPGELYQKPLLSGRTEVSIPGTLLSGLQYEYFDATGTEVSIPNLARAKQHINTRISVDFEIYLEQCFNRKILSPFIQLYFEDVILEKSRMNDVALFLKDMGLETTDPIDLTRQNDKPQYGLYAHKREGRDELFLVFRARGLRTQTDRQTVIPGGKTYTTTVDSGNMEVDVRAELRGNVHKLTGIMNDIHSKLEKLEPFWKTPK